jgi:phage gp16-like protein
MTPNQEQYRRRGDLAAIHVAKKQLRLDDDTYRALLFNLTGHSSAADLDSAQRRLVIEHLRRRGFAPAPGKGAKVEKLAAGAMMKKIRACWLDLKSAGVLRDTSEKALRAFVKRLVKVDSPGWLTPEQANVVIEALKAWHKRVQPERRTIR